LEDGIFLVSHWAQKFSSETQLDGNLFSILIGSRRMRRPLIGARDFEAFIGQGEQAQGRSWRLTKGEDFFVYVEKKKKGR
jgi:hypothetical protein